jgi:hypothetical protein
MPLTREEFKQLADDAWLKVKREAEKPHIYKEYGHWWCEGYIGTCPQKVYERWRLANQHAAGVLHV